MKRKDSSMDVEEKNRRKGISISWKRSSIQPVPDWADRCDRCGRSINSVSKKVAFCNARLVGPNRTGNRKTIRVKNLCRDCRADIAHIRFADSQARIAMLAGLDNEPETC